MSRSGVAHNGDCEIFFDVFGVADNPTLLMVNGLGSQCINYADEWCEMFAAEGMGHDYPPQLWRRWTDLVVGHIQSHS